MREHRGSIRRRCRGSTHRCISIGRNNVRWRPMTPVALQCDAVIRVSGATLVAAVIFTSGICNSVRAAQPDVAAADELAVCPAADEAIAIETSRAGT